MAKTKEFLLTLFITERVCAPIKAKTLSEAKDKLLEAHQNCEIGGIITRDVYEGNLYQFAEPMEAEEWLSFVNKFRKLTGAYGKSRKVK